MDPRTERAILLMATSFRDALTLAAIASKVELSPFHLHRIFKADTLETPAAHLTRIRLEHAAHLMVVVHDAPLLQVALDSGFSSAATFARAFRQHFGETASEYRLRKRLTVNKAAPEANVSLHRLPRRKLRVERCLLSEDALTLAYRRLRLRCTDSPCNVLGIFVDAPFRQERTSCRHYLALEAEPCIDDARAFSLPGGLYARLRVSGDINAVVGEILRFKSEQLDPSPYGIGSTLAFERTQLQRNGAAFDYRRSERDVFIKVRRKHEPAI